MIPGNDDATRAIRLYAQVLADAVIDGRGTKTTGGAKAEPTADAAPAAPAAPAAAEAAADEKEA